MPSNGRPKAINHSEAEKERSRLVFNLASDLLEAIATPVKDSMFDDRCLSYAANKLEECMLWYQKAVTFNFEHGGNDEEAKQ